MEKVKKQNIRNILTLVLISIAIFLLIIHVAHQIIKTSTSENDIIKKDLHFPESHIESLKSDSIWDDTEFMTD